MKVDDFHYIFGTWTLLVITINVYAGIYKKIILNHIWNSMRILQFLFCSLKTYSYIPHTLIFIHIKLTCGPPWPKFISHSIKNTSVY